MAVTPDSGQEAQNWLVSDQSKVFFCRYKERPGSETNINNFLSAPDEINNAEARPAMAGNIREIIFEIGNFPADQLCQNFDQEILFM